MLGWYRSALPAIEPGTTAWEAMTLPLPHSVGPYIYSMGCYCKLSRRSILVYVAKDYFVLDYYVKERSRLYFIFVHFI